MKLLLNTIKILLGSLAAVAISIAMTIGASFCSGGPGNAGPGMIVSFGGTVKGVRIHIKDARLPDGKEFPNAGSFGYSDDPTSGGKEMGAAPDGRQLPEWVDFEWQETPYPWNQRPSQSADEWREEVFATYRALPVKTQRVPIRSRIPQAVVDQVTEENRHPVRGQDTEKRLQINLVWTSQGIKMHWRLWHTPSFNAQYYSHEGGDQIIPEGQAMVAVYASTIKDDTVSVGPGHAITRHPALPDKDRFSGSPNFVSTVRPMSGGGLVVAYERDAQLPEWVDFDWRLFPLVVPRNKGEKDAQYEARVQAIYRALPVHNERVAVRSLIPQDVQDEIAAAARNAVPDKVSNSMMFIYFIWTDSGIKLRWRLLRMLPDGRHVYPREGGDELASPA
jgi:hypothetical protein